jgi:hypothetical protein
MEKILQANGKLFIFFRLLGAVEPAAFGVDGSLPDFHNPSPFTS